MLTPDERRELILELLQRACKSGVSFVPVSHIDRFLLERKPAVFLKHDIHNVAPKKLIDLAEFEAKIGVFGTYFFMSFGHPRGDKFFSAEDQKMMMREVAALGHEVGAHVDVLYDTRHHGKPLRAAVLEQLDVFAEVVGPISVANLHGNSKFKIVDTDGNNLVYDLFDELARQPDYPELRNVAPDVAEYLRENRVSLASLDLSHWGDSWVWSRDNGVVASGLVSDNWMGKEGVLQVTINLETPCAYGLNPRQSLGPRDGHENADWVPAGGPLPKAHRFNQRRLGISDPLTSGFFEEALPAAPFVMLLHPEFYAV